MSKNNELIFNVLEKIFNKTSNAAEETYTWDEIFQALSEYISWVDQIKKDLKIKKEYQIEHIAEQLFSLGSFNKQTCKCHISMLYISLTMLKKELKQVEKELYVTSDFIKEKLALLKDLVWDGSELIGACEKLILEREPTVRRGRRRLFSSNEIFYSSIGLLRRHVDYNDITVSSLPIFQIRQAIETKALNSIGIGEIVGVDGNPAKFKLERLIEFIDCNEKISYPVKKIPCT